MSADPAGKQWSAQDARAHFGEFLEACLQEGPQLLTVRGVEAAVLVSYEEWSRLRGQVRPTLKELLLAETPRLEIPMRPRKK